MARWNEEKSAARPRLGSRIFTIVVLAVLLATVLAAVFVPLGIFRSRGEIVISYGAVTVRRDLYVYWLSAYKYAYLSMMKQSDPTAADTFVFWSETTGSGVTRAEEVRAEADNWIRRIVFAAAFFEDDDDAMLGGKVAEEMENAYRRVLQYEVDTEKAYDRAAKEVGFTYATVRRALLLENEYYAYVSGMDNDTFSAFCTVADGEVAFHAAAEKINFIALPADNSLLYSASPF